MFLRTKQKQQYIRGGANLGFDIRISKSFYDNTLNLGNYGYAGRT